MIWLKNGIQHFATYGDKVTERGASFQKLDQCVKMPVDFGNVFYYWALVFITQADRQTQKHFLLWQNNNSLTFYGVDTIVSSVLHF